MQRFFYVPDRQLRIRISQVFFLRHVFLQISCEAWFQILAGESHVADLAAAPGRDP